MTLLFYFLYMYLQLKKTVMIKIIILVAGLFFLAPSSDSFVKSQLFEDDYNFLTINLDYAIITAVNIRFMSYPHISELIVPFEDRSLYLCKKLLPLDKVLPGD